MPEPKPSSNFLVPQRLVATLMQICFKMVATNENFATGLPPLPQVKMKSCGNSSRKQPKGIGNPLALFM
jgi:hypothetical protein